MVNFLPLDEFFKIVEESWPFDKKEYPCLENMTERNQDVFAMKHVLNHMSKSHGVLAGILERVDHGERFDRATCSDAIRKQLVNIARLATLVDVGPNELDRGVKTWLREAKGMTFD